MSSLIYVYPLDLQADLESNFVHGEQKTLAPGINRVIIPDHGAFYTKDLVVRESVTGRVLEPITDYVPVMYYQEPSERSGLEVMAAIIITNSEIDPAVEYDLRYVGGMYINITQPLIELIANLNLDERTVRWGDLLGKPHAFHPAHHLHDIGDVYGFEYMVESIDRLTLAVLHSDQAAFNEMRQYIDLNDEELHERINVTNSNLGSHVANVSNPHSVTKAQTGLGLVQNMSLSTQAQMAGSLQATSYVTPLALTYYFQTGNGLPITEHLVDVSNPHNTTKAQVGLGIVENFTISTQSEAEVGTVSNKYMTPLRTAQAINKQAGELLNAHITNFGNPHQVTKAQTGLGSVQNYGIATQTEAQAGAVNTKYMTPLRVAEAIVTQALTPLNAHTSRIDNPHSVTKAQVGLGNVLNYGIATQAEAQAGTLNTEYMTPLRVKEAITTQAITPLNAHTARVDNPHSVTKAQVGLGLVEDFSIASKIEAEEGEADDKYMTPLRTKEAIATQALAPLSAHTSRIDNPHSVTKAQVGLSVVENYSISTQAEAQAGTVNTKYMTPLRTKDAIATQALAPLNAHTARVDNPHSVTKTQVGLSNVQNFPIATDVQARAGTATDRYMTPLLTKAAIETLALVPLSNHANRTDNPHAVTKAQVGLGSVENYNIATQAEAQAGALNDKYMTPLRVAQAITVQAGALLNTHASNTNNPHSVTKAQVGLGSVLNYGVSDATAAIAGVSNVLYMTPLRVKEAITAQAGAMLLIHTSNTNNPHQVTKVQVGLSNVENYGLATTAEANAGTINTRYMTPLRTKEAIATQALTPLNAHVIRVDNPHNVTKAQTGLGSVENYPVASAAEANAGTATNRYMTPAVTKSAIDTQAIAPLNTHTSNTNNPHSVTKTQVGLGSVENYGLATKAEAEAGTVNTKYMTPLRTKEAITLQAGTLLNAHVSNNSNPHNVTKAQVGLASVLNYGVSDSASAVAGTSNVLYMTPLRVKEAITAQAGTLLNAHTTNYNNPHQVTKAQVGLGNVDNTSDAAKPVSTAQQTALNAKVDKVTGYGLTQNDFTTALLNKLNGIAAGAQVNVATNLSMGGSGNSRSINSSTGSNVTVPVVTTSDAGFMSTTDKSKLDGIQAGAQANVGTNLGLGTRTTTTVPVTSSTGTNVSLPAATTSLAGVMSSADKVKLNGIAAGAQVNVGTNLSVGASTVDAAVYSSTGNGVNLPRASASSAGVISAAYMQKIDSIQHGAQVNVGTNLGMGGSGNSRTITSSTGGNVSIPVATTANAGFMSTSDKVKLDKILTESGSIKMFVSWIGTGNGNINPVIQKSMNVSSVQRIAEGRYRINYINAMSQNNYPVFGFSRDNDNSGDGTVSQNSTDGVLTTNVVVSTNVNGYDKRDLPFVSVMAID